MSKSKDTARKSSKRESKTASLMMPPSGMIYVPSRVSSLEDWLTSLREGSLASRTVPLDATKELTTTSTSGQKRQGPLAQYDPSMSSWRTLQASFNLFSEENHTSLPSLENLPKWGTTLSGVLWGLEMWGPPMSENGGGVWPGTPTKSGRIRSGGFRKNRLPTPTELVAILQDRVPTPRASDSFRLSFKIESLKKGYKNRFVQKENSFSPNLVEVVAWATGSLPTACFVEMLMGVPVTWTHASQPLETESYQQWWQSFSGG